MPRGRNGEAVGGKKGDKWEGRERIDMWKRKKKWMNGKEEESRHMEEKQEY